MWIYFIIVASTAHFVSRRPADCLGSEDLGQQLNCKTRQRGPNRLSVVRARQSLPPSAGDWRTGRPGSVLDFRPVRSVNPVGSAKCRTAVIKRCGVELPCGIRLGATLFVIAMMVFSSRVEAELFDSLDAYPPRWQLDTSDCDARVIDHKNLSDGGSDGGGCESISFQAGVGSEAILVYPIEPVHAINDLVSNVSVMSARSGARIGLRVRFPYFRDPQTHRPVSGVIYGASYERPGRFQSLGVGSIERELRIKTAQLRAAHGAEANLSDPYVDAIAINAYSGAGATTLRIDQVSVQGMIPLGDHGRVDEVPGQVEGPSAVAKQMLQMRRPSYAPEPRSDVAMTPAFPQGNLIRILEHKGEPLAWVRSLGFDAVLLSEPPTAEILREAIQSQLLVYSPPPVAPDPSIGTLLDPVVAWYLGGGVALDRDRVSQTDKTVRRLRQFPVSWQRPIVIAPVESWMSYATIGDAIVSDAVLRGRGLPAAEHALILQGRRERMGAGTELAVAIESSSPAKLAAMNRTIESSIGAPPDGNFRWHSMLTQAIQALEQTPRAIVFRSHESLVSGTVYSHQRSMALSYTNRFMAMITPWIASARAAPPYGIAGAAYRCSRLETHGDEFLLLTSDQAVRDQTLAGDGRSVEILLPPEMVNRTAWRLTNFSAQRIDIDSVPTGARIEIVSPDVAEIIVISGDATLGGRLAQSARRFVARAASDRWQLSGDQVRQIRADWDHAVTSGATEAIMPVDLLTAAQRTLGDAESVYRAGDAESTLRLSRRADAWGVRAGAQLSQALLPRRRNGELLQYVSSPPMDEGRATLQTAWQPLMRDEGWSGNLIASGGLDTADILDAKGWAFGQRKLARANSDARWISRGFFSGQGAISLSASSNGGEPLGGGYEGTIAILSSPAVPIEPTQAVRIDAMIRTIGFGRAHQGVLVYDTLGGQEMGVLVRGATEWTPVRLYRQSSGETEVKVMFEVIGDGEAVIDEVGVRAWAPSRLPDLPLRPISP